jgi:hypothetical protein
MLKCNKKDWGGGANAWSSHGQATTDQRRMGIDARSRGRQSRKSVGRSGMAYNENLEVQRRQVSKRSRDQYWLIAKFGSRKVRGTVWSPKRQLSKRSEGRGWLTGKFGVREVGVQYGCHAGK